MKKVDISRFPRYAKHVVTPAGSQTYAYDANGNKTLGTDDSLSYGMENRFAEVFAIW